ncbi:MAG: glycosyltransferase family 4 protein [Tenericutes bacterium]|nr:glycosyltransferase family 4 protein [Mycoplasmatota bacterium]MDY3801794.1 glycosyltransferase family 4 protein [Bacilli bacterium]
MRIGIFTDTYPPYINGVSTSVSMLENALRKKGHQVYIVTVNTENMRYKYENDEHIIRIPGVPIGIYDYRLTGVYPLKAINKIKKWNLDVIHSHTEFGVGTFARIIAKQYNIPLVHTYHTMYEDYVHYITKGYFNNTSKKIVEYLTNFYCNQTATELIVPTKKTYDLFKEKYKYTRNVHIIPTGIEVEKFYKENTDPAKLEEIRKKHGLNKGDFVILYVGRLGQEKSVDVLIEAHQELAREYKAKLLIVGDGPDMDTYKNLVHKLKIDDNVIFTGKVPWTEVTLYYQIADIFATASKSETQGLTVIEAMAASLPVVAVDDESFRNVIIDGLNGHLFDTKKEYKKYVKSFIDEPSKLQQFSKQARINADTYSSKYFAERVLDVYRLAINGETSEEKNSVKNGFKATLKGIFKWKK